MQLKMLATVRRAEAPRGLFIETSEPNVWNWWWRLWCHHFWWSVSLLKNVEDFHWKIWFLIMFNNTVVSSSSLHFQLFCVSFVVALVILSLRGQLRVSLLSSQFSPEGVFSPFYWSVVILDDLLCLCSQSVSLWVFLASWTLDKGGSVQEFVLPADQILDLIGFCTSSSMFHGNMADIIRCVL